MVWIKIMNNIKNQTKEQYKTQPCMLSEIEVQQVLEQICENINFDILCQKTDVRNMNENIFVIESATVLFLESPVVTLKKEEKKFSVWRRIKSRLLRGEQQIPSKENKKS